MAAVVSRQGYVSATNGAMVGLTEGTFGNQTTLWPGNVMAGKYSVPAGKSVRVATLAWSCAKPYNVLAAVAAATVNTGVVEVLVNGTVVQERRVQGAVLPNGAGWEDLCQPHQSANNLLNFGDGILVPSGQTLLIRCDPANATETMWFASAHGILSGAPSMQVGRAWTRTTTADQTILSYTPGSDYTLKRLDVWGQQVGQIGGTMGVYLNGMPAFEIGRCGQGQSACMPMGPDNFGAVIIPLWGITMYPKDTVSLGIQPWDADATEWQQVVVGTDADLSGGGGGNTYSRGRVVNA